MTMVIAADLTIAFETTTRHDADQALLAHGLDQSFRQHHDAISLTLHVAFDDRADDDVGDFLRRDRFAAELLRDNDERNSDNLAYTQRKMTGRATHADNDVPARDDAN